MQNEFTFGNITIARKELAESTIDVAIHRMIAHCLGNRVASGMTTYKEANPNATAKQIAAKETELRDYQLVRLKTQGAHEIGARAGSTNIEAVIKRLARDAVTNHAKKTGRKLTTKERDKAVESLIEKQGDKLRARAEKELAEIRARVAVESIGDFVDAIAV